MTRVGLVGAVLGLLLAGCVSAAKTCDRGRNRGWFSGWGIGGSRVFSLGLRRTWDECAAPATVPGRPAVEPLPSPSAEPAAEPTAPHSWTGQERHGGFRTTGGGCRTLDQQTA